jgi:hypothetical protein
MIERFDHRPMLTALLALSTTVLVVVVLTLATLLITGPQAVSPPSASGGSNPATHAQSGGRVGSGAGAYFGNDSLREQQVPPVSAAPRRWTLNRMAKFTDGIFNQKLNGLEYTIKPESATRNR